MIVAIDVEAYERDQRRVLEVGMAQFEAGVISCRHLVITENVHFRNGKYVADNRDHFLFGQSEFVTQREAVRIVSATFGAAATLVGHAVQGDINWLQSMGVDTDTNGAEMVDTQLLAGGRSGRRKSLQSLAEEHGLSPRRLHNAGNDAYYTLAVMLCQTGARFEPLRPSGDTSSSHLAAAARRQRRESWHREEERCPECDSYEHTTPTTECMGIYFTDWGTMGYGGDGEEGDPETYPHYHY